MCSEVRNSLEKTLFPKEDCPGRDKDLVRFVQIDEAHEGQRLDNFLLTFSKGVPKSHVYRIVRSGEVRVNKKRAEVSTRLTLGDIVRIPPMRFSEPSSRKAPAFRKDELHVLFEDRDLLIIDKPAGLAAHGGSGIDFGLIERLRASRPQCSMLELAHRLDRDTSGAIVVCKTRKALVRFQAQIRAGEIEKRYRLLVLGDWVNEREHVKLPLAKYSLASGERRVRVQEGGLSAHTVFNRLERFGVATLLEAELKTGRTHQIRVHAASKGFPLVGDEKYGDYAKNAQIARGSLGVAFPRMFLHAYSIGFTHPTTGEAMQIIAPLPEPCERLLEVLRREARS